MEKSKRWPLMVEKYGSEEAAKAEMRRRAEKSSRNKVGTGGFAALTAEQRKEVSRKGGKASSKNASSD